MKKQPEKTAQTRQNILDAFWEITKKRGLNKTTISEITQCAELNRGTFYVYFSDMDDLLYQAEQEIIADLHSKLHSAIVHDELLDFHSVSSKIIEIIGRYNDKLFILLGKDGDPLFLSLIRREAATVISSVLQLLQSSEQNPYQDYIIAYITSAFTGLLQFWHETGKELPLNELSGIAYGMTFYGLTGLKGQTE